MSEIKEASFSIEKTYIQNVNFTSEGQAPVPFKPELGFDLDVKSFIDRKARRVTIEFNIGVSAKAEGSSIFKLDLVSIGVFSGNESVDDKQLDTFANLNGPSILFPNVRTAVSMFVLASGFPPPMLPLVNFNESKVEIKEV